MIYDCFLFNGEFDLLSIRIAELAGIKNLTHVLVESKVTFTGMEKPRKTIALGERFRDTKRLVIDLTLENPSTNPWDNEKNLRNRIKDFLAYSPLMVNYNPIQDDDIIIISDIDEVPRASSIKDWNGPEYTCLIMNKYGFWLNCEEEHQGWHRARMMRWEYLKATTPEEVRHAGIPSRIENAGWHWSWQGGIDEVMRKFASFSHQEPDVQKHANREELMRKILVGESLWGNDKWKIVPIDETFPQYVQDHQNDSLKHMIYGNS